MTCFKVKLLLEELEREHRLIVARAGSGVLTDP